MGSLKTGGAERTCSRLANYLCARGEEVHLILRKNVVRFELDPRVRLHLLGRPRSTSPLGKIRSIRHMLRRAIRGIAPDAVCAFTGLSGVLLSTTFTRRTIVRFSTYPRNLRRWKQSLFYTHFNLPHIHRVICLTADMKYDLRRLISASKLTVIHNAAIRPEIDPQDYARQQHLIPPRKYIVSLGRLSVAKGYDVALRAYALGRLYESHDYVLIGGGVAENMLRRLSQRLGIERYVHFVGYQSNPYPLLAGADIFLHTSLREGFPNVLVEALSLGVPVVATDCKTGPSEIVEPDVNGYLVAVNDVAAIAKRLRFLANHEVVRQELARKAPLSIQKFEENHIFAQWHALLREES